jgi:LysM repeat protein
MVQPGDTLTGIAARYGVSVNRLAQANGLSPDDWVYVGQRLTIPGPPPKPRDTYLVRRGDTLSGLARRFGTTVGAIMAANNLTGTTIYAGQHLVIPGAQDPSDPGAGYLVQWGDTLSGLARRFGTTVGAIMAANNLTRTTIYAGQRLVIPGHDGPSVPPPTWVTYTNAEYGFSFRYPTSWTLEEEANLVRLSQGMLAFLIAFQRQGEGVNPPWTGMPAGALQDRGVMSFMEGTIARQALVYEGQVKVLIYHAEVGELAFAMRLEDVVTADYDRIELAAPLVGEADQIIGSFR